MDCDYQVVLVFTEIEERTEKFDLDDLEIGDVLVCARKTELKKGRLRIDLCITIPTVEHNNACDGRLGTLRFWHRDTGSILLRGIRSSDTEFFVLEFFLFGCEGGSRGILELEVRGELSVIRSSVEWRRNRGFGSCGPRVCRFCIGA